LSNKYINPIKWLGGAALIVVLFGQIFVPFSSVFLSEDTRNGVLVQSIPFVTIFIGILLLFILTIALVALRFNSKIPGRSYHGVEYTVVAGIVIGVICLFQSWSIVPYRYGFILLLGSTLGFILWSHVVPSSAKIDEDLPPLTSKQHLIAGIAGLVVVAFLTWSAATANAPVEPYGIRERVWNSYTDERKAEIASAATSQFTTVEVPFLLVFNLFPASIVYFIVRELFSERRKAKPALKSAPITSGSEPIDALLKKG
jgi:hypothetical protein